MHPQLRGLREHIVTTFALNVEPLHAHEGHHSRKSFCLLSEVWQADAVLAAVRGYFVEQDCTAEAQPRICEVFPPVIVRQVEPLRSAVITITIHGRQLYVGEAGMELLTA